MNAQWVWVGIGLLVVGIGCLLAANRGQPTVSEQKRLRWTAVVANVGAAVSFIVAAFLR